jgi:hypothetical protein
MSQICLGFPRQVRYCPSPKTDNNKSLEGEKKEEEKN